MVYYFVVSEELIAANSFAMRIPDLFSYDLHDYINRIKILNEIMVDKERNKGKQHICYKLEQWNKIGNFDTLNSISEHITPVQLMESLGNFNHAVSVVGKWIFDYNNKKYLLLSIESLNLICYFSKEEKDLHCLTEFFMM